MTENGGLNYEINCLLAELEMHNTMVKLIKERLLVLSKKANRHIDVG